MITAEGNSEVLVDVISQLPRKLVWLELVLDFENRPFIDLGHSFKQ